jgi:biopolymer transport protein ExbB/TolQ
MEVENVLFDIAEALRIPVLVAALLALALVLFELGGMVAELFRRRGRSRTKLDQAIASAGAALSAGDAGRAYLELGKVANSKSMRAVMGSIVEHRAATNGADRLAKDLAEFDYASVRRLERTRILVRVGPALGLMGTLIPLSPALAGLAEGDIETLSDNLRVAFSVTVAGLLIGAIAYGISLVRDRLYGQDFSDLEYIASALAPGAILPRPTATSTQTGAPAGASPTAVSPEAASGGAPTKPAVPPPAPAPEPATQPTQVAPAEPAAPAQQAAPAQSAESQPPAPEQPGTQPGGGT